MRSWNYWRDLINLFFPNLCLVCGEQQPLPKEPICLNCLAAFPETNFHQQTENALTEIFWGRLPIEFGTAMFYFRKAGLIQQLVHQLKYKGQKEVGVFLGNIYGRKLMESPSYSSIDLIIPVPLHPRKQRIRGYNQSTQFGIGLSQSLHIPCTEKILIRTQYTDTQTQKGRFERIQNVSEAFKINKPELLRNKHLLLVDDVLTTGATLEACGQKLLEVPGVKLSVATMAIAR